MDKITYKELSSGNVAVYLKGTRVGTITDVMGGWQYFPKGRLTGGEIMASVQAVKQSLESDE